MKSPAIDVTKELLREPFPDPLSSLEALSTPLDAVVRSGDIVLDTNVLLLPYRVGRDSLDAIRRVLTQCAKEKRLFVPTQVVREYVRLRPSKIVELCQYLNNHSSKAVRPEALQFPLLEQLTEYKALKEAETALRAAVDKYQSSLSEVGSVVERWTSSDPVSDIYREVLSSACLIESPLLGEDLEAVRKARYERKLPPGYKDAGKDDGGVGDLSIWLAILERGRSHKRDLVFVSGDEKADWQYRANGRGLMPRGELIDEYRRWAPGRSFYIIHMSKMLEILGGADAAVAQVEREEVRVRVKSLEFIACPYCGTRNTWPIDFRIGSSAKPRCTTCDNWYHAHRTSSGVIVRRRGVRPAAREEMRAWFFEHYMDPANGVPHESAEGGYQYFNGGPFDAHEELTDKFSGVYSEDEIKDIADEIESQHGVEWVRVEDY